MTHLFMIPGAPSTKKTGQRIARSGSGVPFILPSAKSKAWEALAVRHLTQQRGNTITDPVSVTATFYRKANYAGDLHGYLQALGDALERAKVITNDRLIKSWDGSRLRVDAVNPRVEVTIRAYTEEAA